MGLIRRDSSLYKDIVCVKVNLERTELGEGSTHVGMFTLDSFSYFDRK